MRIQKYQTPVNGIIMQDNTHVAKPIEQTFIKRTYQPKQTYLSQGQQPLKDNNEQLYKNQHLWNWSAPFNNTRLNKNNSKALFDFNKSSGIGTFAVGTALANPIATATSTAGSFIGTGVGNQVAGEKGGFIGGLVGGMFGITPKRPKFKQTTNKEASIGGASKSSKTDISKNANNAYKKLLNFYESDYWISHLRKQGMSDEQINTYIDEQVNNLLEAIKPTENTGIKIYKLQDFQRKFGGGNGGHTYYEKDGIVTGRNVNLTDNSTEETVLHEFLHAANKGGASHELGKPINETPNSVAQHNELFKADVKTPPLQIPNSPYAMTKEHPFYKQLNLTEEQRSRAIVTHQKLNEYNTTFDDVQKVLYSQSNDFQSIGLSQQQYQNAKRFIQDNLENFETSDGLTPSNIWQIFNWFTPQSMNKFMKNVRQFSAPIGFSSFYGLNEYGRKN